MEPPRASGEELLEVVVEAGAGDILLAGGRDGIYVREAHRGSGLRQGDRLLSARVFFEDVRCEDAARVLRCAQPCRVSFCLKRPGPGGRGPPGTTTAPPQGKEPKAKVAKLNLLSLAPLKKKPPPSPPVDVELALPKLALLPPRGGAGTEPPPATPSPPRAVPEAPRPQRVTVREEAAALEVALPGTLTEPGGGTPGGGGGPPLARRGGGGPQSGGAQSGGAQSGGPQGGGPQGGAGRPPSPRR
nr:periaxin [Anas platyrhynchos]